MTERTRRGSPAGKSVILDALTEAARQARGRPETLLEISNRLDEAVRDAEEFLVAQGFGLEASVPLEPVDDDVPEKHSYLSFSRGKEEWQLFFLLDDGSSKRWLPLVDVSRTRKRLALMQFGKLVRLLQEEASLNTTKIAAAIDHVKNVMASEDSK